MAWSKKNKQAISKPSDLAMAFTTGMDNAEAVSTDQLIAETGKSRQQILDIVMADDEVLSCLDDIDGAIKKEKWRIYAPNAELDEALINQFYAIVRDILPELIAVAILAKLNGYAVAEYTFDQTTDGLCFINSVLNKDGELDKYTPKRDGSVTIDNNGQAEVINQVVKFCVLKSKAVPARPYGEMTIIRAYPAVAMRRKEWAYAGQFIMRYAQPYVIGKQGGFGVTLENFTSKISSFISGGAIGVGKDDDITLHQLSGNGDAFDVLERMANSRIQKLLLGRVKTSELSSGSRSAQETDDAARVGRISSYLTLVTKGVQHAINAMLLVNQYYGLRINAPQGIIFEFESQAKLDATLATTAKTYSEIAGFEFTDDFFLNVVGFEASHFKFTPKNASTSDTKLGLNGPYHLAKPPQNAVTSPDPTFDHTPDLQKIAKAKMDVILSLLSDSENFKDFNRALEDLTLPDGGMVGDLATQTSKAYVKGLDGVKNADGENNL